MDPRFIIFSGAAPLTLYKSLLGSTPVDGAAWDRSNHLYAISTVDNILWVFTVTPTSVIEDSTSSIGRLTELLSSPGKPHSMVRDGGGAPQERQETGSNVVKTRGIEAGAALQVKLV
jgi:hypothetical protein